MACIECKTLIATPWAVETKDGHVLTVYRCPVCDARYSVAPAMMKVEITQTTFDEADIDEDDTPAVGDAPNDYAWSEHDEGKAHIIMKKG
jgi:hypothetical protein